MSKELSKPAPKFMIIDDHELLLDGTVNMIKKHYPTVEIITAQTTEIAQETLTKIQPDLVITDLSLPEKSGEIAKIENGIALLKTIFKTYPHLNLLVQSTYIKALIRIKPNIDNHKGGFGVADKSLSIAEILHRVELVLKGLSHTKDIKSTANGLEFKPEWLTVLTLAFEEGLQDKAIAQRMFISERMIRHYWTKVQDVLGVYPEGGKNIRIQTEKKAREEGLID
jgi:DNA-binding NarL/FixJ family response regulator